MIRVVTFTKEELERMISGEVVYGEDSDKNLEQYMSEERFNDMLINGEKFTLREEGERLRLTLNHAFGETVERMERDYKVAKAAIRTFIFNLRRRKKRE